MQRNLDNAENSTIIEMAMLESEEIEDFSWLLRASYCDLESDSPLILITIRVPNKSDRPIQSAHDVSLKSVHDVVEIASNLVQNTFLQF